MPRELLERELLYQSSMQMFRSLMDKNIITKADYTTAEKMMREKYNPKLGTLFFDISLT
ncbi:MAG: hypothetical protein J6I62_05050 [Selenomonadaceae bacterium]|nr:hypothetical protein [Selenomonadaceae bacterium]